MPSEQRRAVRSSATFSWGRALAGVIVATVALGTAYKGVQFWRSDMANRTLSRLMKSEAGTNTPEAVTNALGAVDVWRDEPGLRSRARASYRAGEMALLSSSPDALADAQALVGIDPATSHFWLDLTKIAWRGTATRDLAMRANEMSVITGPYEAGLMEQRIRFVMSAWPNAPVNMRQKAIQEIALLLQSPRATFRHRWPQIVSYLPVEQRRAINGMIKTVYPGYTGWS